MEILISSLTIFAPVWINKFSSVVLSGGISYNILFTFSVPNLISFQSRIFKNGNLVFWSLLTFFFINSTFFLFSWVNIDVFLGSEVIWFFNIVNFNSFSKLSLSIFIVIYPSTYFVACLRQIIIRSLKSTRLDRQVFDSYWIYRILSRSPFSISYILFANDWLRQWSGRPEFNIRSSHTKDSKMVLDSTLLNSQHYKIRIKCKVEQSMERLKKWYVIPPCLTLSIIR